MLRLGANGELRLTQLEYGRTQLELAKGVLSYRVQRTTEENIEIDTPSVSVRPSRQGSYRVSVNDGGETEVTARGGDVEFSIRKARNGCIAGRRCWRAARTATRSSRLWRREGRTIGIAGAKAGIGAITQSASYKYVGQGVYGAEDLDAYGTWDYTPDYGYVWQPWWQRAGHPTVWALGLGRLVWLDLGQLRSVGLGAVPLWTMVLRRAVGMELVPGVDHGAALLVSGVGWVLWLRTRCRGRHRLWVWQRGLGGIGSVRSVPSVVGKGLLRWCWIRQPFREYYECKYNQHI